MIENFLGIHNKVLPSFILIINLSDVYLGESFTFYVCVLNESKQIHKILNLKVRVEIYLYIFVCMYNVFRTIDNSLIVNRLMCKHRLKGFHWQAYTLIIIMLN